MNDDAEILVDGRAWPGGTADEPDEPRASATWLDRGHRVLLIRRDGKQPMVVVEGGPSDWVAIVRGRRIAVTVRTHRDRLIAESGGASGPRRGSADVRATLPGLVVRVLVALDEEVAEGDPLVIVEAMKMENEIRAPRGGRVTALEVSPGQVIQGGALLVRLSDPAP